MMRVAILTISDKGAQGKRQDESGQIIRSTVSAGNGQVARYEIVPDEMDMIAGKLAEWADTGNIDVILTTGGTGLGARDITPEATLSIIDKLVPGFAEIMRIKTFDVTPRAVLSRAVAGVRGKCLIINMPGSPKAVRECLEIIFPAIPHAVEMITGTVTEHAIERGESVAN